MKLKSGKTGFTLIETIMTVSLLAVILIILNSGLIGGRKAVKKGMEHLNRFDEINRVLEYCKRSLRYAVSIEQTNTGVETRYIITYVDKIEPDGITNQQRIMTLVSRPEGNNTEIRIIYRGKEISHVLDGINLLISSAANLTTVEMSHLDGRRPPVVLSLFSPFMDSWGASAGDGSETDSLPGDPLLPGVSSESSDLDFNTVDFSNEQSPGNSSSDNKEGGSSEEDEDHFELSVSSWPEIKQISK